MKRTFTCFALALSALLLSESGAAASGMLLPKDDTLPPLAIVNQRVAISIESGVAEVTIEQVFRNHTDRDLEAVYVFPLPADAVIADFAMTIDGRRVSGELVEKDRARQIYRDIVRRLQDPGLLEYLGGNLFRISIYPVPRRGDQKVEIVYSQTLAFESGLYRFVYPLKTGERASRTLEDFTISARVKSDVAIGNLYSPSHEVDIVRKSDRECVLGFEEVGSLLDRDFELFFSVARGDLDMSLLTHAAADEAGFFMLMLAPAVLAPDIQPPPKDVVFVVDTSGSMRGEKIEQARRALAYSVKRLNPGDRFNLIRFATDVEPISERLLEANEANRAKVLETIAQTVARGGTAIDDALAAAFKMDFGPKRAAIIVFVTDGRPTIGESNPDIILKHVAHLNARGVRLFVFGVGDEVNTRLLDSLSAENGGVSYYVRPEENIEIRLAAFADKISHPVLTSPRLEIEGVRISRMTPRTLPDLFGGERILAFGRYEGNGHVAIRLRGEVDGEPREFVHEGSFPDVQSGNTFIPPLWATRRIGFLLEEIRLRGESRELKDEVTRLSREYGVMTPYTSYLVLENEKAYERHGLREPGERRRAHEVFAGSPAPRPRIGGGVDAGPAPMSQAPAMVPIFSADDADALGGIAAVRRSATETHVLREAPARIDGYLRQETGAEAVDLSQAIRAYQNRATLRDDLAAVRHVGRRVFLWIDERWVDSRYRDGLPSRRIGFGSDEYFRVIEAQPELKDALALGFRVTIVLDDNTALIVE